MGETCQTCTVAAPSTRTQRPLSQVPLAVEEVCPGLFRIEIAIRNAPGKVNLFVERGPHGVLVIDAASDYPEARIALADGFKQIGLTLQDVTDIVISHLHIDHYGMAGWLSELSGAPVWIHEAGGFELWRHWNPSEAGERLVAFAAAHGASAERAVRISILDDWRYLLTLPKGFRQLVHGESRAWVGRNWKVIFTPGHAAGHICLWCEEDKVLVGGDQLLAAANAAVRWFNDELADPLGAYLRGLQGLAKLSPKLLLPGHGPVVTEVIALVRSTTKHHRTTIARLFDLLDQPRNAMQLVQAVYGELSDFRLRVVLTEVVACLRYLEIQGKAVSMLHGRVIHFGKATTDKRVWAWGPQLETGEFAAGQNINKENT
jgi:glyoxylase-like metal-dependent hydrolase (beta-lactamase superfamily II)